MHAAEERLIQGRRAALEFAGSLRSEHWFLRHVLIAPLRWEDFRFNCQVWAHQKRATVTGTPLAVGPSSAVPGPEPAMVTSRVDDDVCRSSAVGKNSAVVLGALGVTPLVESLFAQSTA